MANMQPVLTDANELIAFHIKELRLLAQHKGATLHFEPEPHTPRLMIDPLVFGQILNILVENAIRYTKSHEGQVHIRFLRSRGGFELSVSDNGIGIPDADQAHIFSRFYRASNAVNFSEQGTGLGLYLVKLIVESFGGKISFTSKVGKGTNFHVLIPNVGMGHRL